ncbi:MAG: hypothetical protein KIS66_18065 [Fimbriimonadaceae bacterium]|nr:hypothetical protein [Fimbriimonadaceae bacterium]
MLQAALAQLTTREPENPLSLKRALSEAATRANPNRVPEGVRRIRDLDAKARANRKPPTENLGGPTVSTSLTMGELLTGERGATILPQVPRSGLGIHRREQELYGRSQTQARIEDLPSSVESAMARFDEQNFGRRTYGEGRGLSATQQMQRAAYRANLIRSGLEATVEGAGLPTAEVSRRQTPEQTRAMLQSGEPGSEFSQGVQPFLAGVASGVPEGLAGAAGAARGMAIGSRAGPIGGLVGTLVGAFGMGSLERQLERWADMGFRAVGGRTPFETVRKALEEEMAANPGAGAVGEMLGSTVAFAPNAEKVALAASHLREWIAAGRSAKWGASNPAKVANIVDVAFGAASQTGIEATRQVAEGKPDPLRLAASVVLGGLFSEPNALGRKMGLRPTAMEPIRAKSPAEPLSAATPSEVPPAALERGRTNPGPVSEAAVMSPDPTKGVTPQSLAEMSAADIERLADQAEDFERNVSRDVFGDRAAEYDAAVRGTNKGNASAEARMREMEASLTPEQRDRLYGRAGDGLDADQIGAYRRVAVDVHLATTADEIAEALERHVSRAQAGGTVDDLTAFALGRAEKRARELGIDPVEIGVASKSRRETISGPKIADQLHPNAGKSDALPVPEPKAKPKPIAYDTEDARPREEVDPRPRRDTFADPLGPDEIANTRKRVWLDLPGADDGQQGVFLGPERVKNVETGEGAVGRFVLGQNAGDVGVVTEFEGGRLTVEFPGDRTLLMDPDGARFVTPEAARAHGNDKAWVKSRAGNIAEGKVHDSNRPGRQATPGEAKLARIWEHLSGLRRDLYGSGRVRASAGDEGVGGSWARGYAEQPREAGSASPRRLVTPHGEASVSRTYRPSETMAKRFGDAQVEAHPVHELEYTDANREWFKKSLLEVYEGSDVGKQVQDPLSPNFDLAGARMFVVGEGDAVFALKGDDIVYAGKVPGSKASNVAYSMLQLAVDEGGRRLDAFDGFLPEIYSDTGFKAVARLPFDPKYAPRGWNVEEMGKPDIVGMVFDPAHNSRYVKGDGKYVVSYDDIAVAQRGALKTSAQAKAPGGETGKVPKPEAVEENLERPKTGPPVPVAPIQGQPVANIEERIDAFAEALGKTIRRDRTPGRAVGSYRPGDTRVNARRGDVPTDAHELFHNLDDETGISQRAMGEDWFDAEILGPAEYGKTTPKGATADQTRFERWAEFMTAYALNPDEARRLSPNAVAWMEGNLPADALKAIRTFSDDVRRFAGSTGADQTASRVVMDKPEPSKVERVRGFFRPEGAGYRTSGMDKVRYHLSNDLAPLESAVRELMRRKGIDKVLPSEDVAGLASDYRYVDNKVDDMLVEGVTDAAGKRITRPIAEMFDGLDDSSLEALEKDVRDGLSLMISERALERNAKTGVGMGLADDLDVARRTVAELEADPERIAKLRKFSEGYRAHADALLKYALENGYLSKADYDRIRLDNRFYVSMAREGFEDIQATRRAGGLVNGTELFQRFDGSAREIVNPIASLLAQTHKVVREVDRNNVLQKLYDLAAPSDRAMQGPNRVSTEDIVRVVDKGTEGAVKVRIDGETKYVVMEDELRKSLDSLSAMSGRIPILDGVVAGAARLVRDTATKMPAFAVRNRIRDALDRVINSEAGSPLFLPNKKQAALRQDELNSLYKRYGAGIGRGHYMDGPTDWYRVQREMMSAHAKDPKSRFLALPHDAWKRYEGFLDSSEIKGRLVEFEKAYEAALAEGLPDHEAKIKAARQARGLLDFMRAGTLIRAANRYVPFLNAGVQGSLKTLNTIKSNPGRTAKRVLFYQGLTAAAQYALVASDPKKLEEYRQLPPDQRTLFWNIPAGDKWITIPRGFAYGSIGSALERGIDLANGNERAFEGYTGIALQSILPVDPAVMPAMFKGPVEVGFNVDTFRERPIVPNHESKLDLDLRNTEHASEIGKAVQKILRVDARQVDHLIQSYLTSAGRMAMDVSDVIAGKKDAGTVALRATGLVREGSVSASRDVQWVEETAARLGVSGGRLKEFRDLKKKAFADPSFKPKVMEAARSLRDKIEPRLSGDAKRDQATVKRAFGIKSRD